MLDHNHITRLQIIFLKTFKFTKSTLHTSKILSFIKRNGQNLFKNCTRNRPHKKIKAAKNEKRKKIIFSEKQNFCRHLTS
jgi:hypothetical protein